jgi:hypothetical protein
VGGKYYVTIDPFRELLNIFARQSGGLSQKNGKILLASSGEKRRKENVGLKQMQTDKT